MGHSIEIVVTNMGAVGGTNYIQWVRLRFCRIFILQTAFLIFIACGYTALLLLECEECKQFVSYKVLCRRLH